jgi:uncharacterized protein YndB with AHSA1/START domain
VLDRKVFKVTINAPIHDVWREITRTDRPIPCFFNCRLDTPMLAAGSKMAMRSANGKYTGVVGEILEIRPPTRFAHTFRFTNFDDPPCRVIYDLKDVDGTTEFTLTIEDLAAGTRTAKQMMQGATLINNTLKSVMETGRPSLGVRLLFTLFKLTGPLTPKKCYSENWPVR